MDQAIGVMGTGWGAFLAETIRHLDPNREIHLFGRDVERTKRLARKIHATSVFGSVEKMLDAETISAFVVALPHCLHRSVALRAAAQNKAVFLEKPVARSCEEAAAILGAARHAGTVLHVGENVQFRSDILEAQRMIRAGQIGTPVYMLCSSMNRRAVRGWRTSVVQMGGGILVDLAVHHVRAIRMLMGSPSRATGRVVTKLVPEMEGEDTAILNLEGNGWTAESRLSWGVESGDLPEFVIMGSEGSLQLWPGKPYLMSYPRNPRGVRAFLQRHLTARLTSRLFRTTQHERIRLGGHDLLGYEQELRAFLSAIDQDECSYHNAAEAIADLSIVEEASQHFCCPMPRCTLNSIDRCLQVCAASARQAPLTTPF